MMQDQVGKNDAIYSNVTAQHYLAYRPPLHSILLRAALVHCATTDFQQGLDMGCGVGHSAVALTNYCQEVVGLEPSPFMLQHSIKHKRIHYNQLQKIPLHFPVAHFDLITFAGTLYYAKSQGLLDEVLRVLRPLGYILLYDFEVLLQDLFENLGIAQQLPSSDYQHDIDFEGLDTATLKLSDKQTFSHSFFATPTDLAHLICSVPEQRFALNQVFSTGNPFAQLVKSLQAKDKYSIDANCYFTLYQNSL